MGKLPQLPLSQLDREWLALTFQSFKVDQPLSISETMIGFRHFRNRNPVPTQGELWFLYVAQLYIASEDSNVPQFSFVQMVVGM